MRPRGVSPTAFHTCGGTRGGRKAPANARVLSFSGTLLCSPSRAHDRGVGSGVEHQIELTAESLWNEVAGRLRGALNDATYSTWFGEAAGLELSDNCFVLRVPNDFTRDWIEGHFLGLIGAAVRDVTGMERPVEVRVSEPQVSPRDIEEDDVSEEAPVERIVTSTRPESGGFNAKYTFDSFVIGSSNRFAHAA